MVMTAKIKLAGKSVLLVEDEAVVVDVIREVIAPFVLAFDVACTGPDALACIMRRDYDIILLDLKMPKMSGLKLFDYIRDIKPHLLSRTIIVTGDAESEHVKVFIKQNGRPCLAKPFKIKELYNTIASIT